MLMRRTIIEGTYNCWKHDSGAGWRDRQWDNAACRRHVWIVADTCGQLTCKCSHQNIYII